MEKNLNYCVISYISSNHVLLRLATCVLTKYLLDCLYKTYKLKIYNNLYHKNQKVYFKDALRLYFHIHINIRKILKTYYFLFI